LVGGKREIAKDLGVGEREAMGEEIGHGETVKGVKKSFSLRSKVYIPLQPGVSGPGPEYPENPDFPDRPRRFRSP
jgi:hypothetical protein